jgi:hypothetical protein
MSSDAEIPFSSPLTQAQEQKKKVLFKKFRSQFRPNRITLHFSMENGNPGDVAGGLVREKGAVSFPGEGSGPKS